MSLFFILKTSDQFNARFAYHCLWAFLVVGVLVLFGCKSTKLVPEGQYLLVKNKIKTTDSGSIFKKVISKMDDDNALYIKHKPNKKILLLGRFHLRLYNLGSSKKHPEKNDRNKIRRTLRRIGESPVILDTAEVTRSEINLRNYLFSKGYFNCQVAHKIDYRKKKAVVTYYIIPYKPFIIEKVNLSADDAEIDSFLNANMEASHLQHGDVIDMEAISQERNRITILMKNNGYYDFTKDYIDFELDTLREGNTVNVNISVSNKTDGERFVIKTIRQVNVVFENDSETYRPTPPLRFMNMNFYLNGFPVKPNIIAKNISIREGDIYKYNELEMTYNKLSELPIFKFIDIHYVKSPSDSLNQLDAFVILRTNYRQAFTIEPQGIVSQLNRIQNINFGNSYGVANSLVWTHRNLFHNAEQFDISANTRIETQLFRDTATNKYKYFNPAYQQSLNLTLSIPKAHTLEVAILKLSQLDRLLGLGLIKPMDKWKFLRSAKTNFNLSFLYENNPDYVRRILPLTYQYQVQTRRFTHFINVLEMSFSRNTLHVDLTGRTDSAFIRRLFSNTLITSSSWTFLFNDRNTSKSKTHYFIRTNVLELGGNLHRLIRRATDDTRKSDTSYQLLKVNYYQYAKSEIDARCSTDLDENNSTAVRLNIGLAVPYGNQKVMPFDKLFFIGGSNSLRAWRPRTVGPGSYSESSKNFRINRAGDLIMQSSAEFRFDIFDKRLEGALFVDAGNVWLLSNREDSIEQKVFRADRFLSEIAINTGVGLRIDFQFFLFRLDWGMQMRNPEKPLKERWVIKDFARYNYFTKYSILNFGIGYPF